MGRLYEIQITNVCTCTFSRGKEALIHTLCDTTEVMNNDPHHTALPPTRTNREFVKIILICVNIKGNISFDQDDIWSTKTGCYCKRLYKNIRKY